MIEAPGREHRRRTEPAIANATHEVIAVTDADCELEPGWLEAVVAPIEAGRRRRVRASTRPIVDGFFQPASRR